ncbi:MAG: hypothetical protein ACI9M3_001872, partial [Bacteroidia bacterium]
HIKRKLSLNVLRSLIKTSSDALTPPRRKLLSLNVLRSLIKTSSDALTPPRRRLLSLDVAYFKERFSS